MSGNYMLQKIIIKNFISFKHAEIEFPLESGTYIITGHNIQKDSSNGAGKSSFIQAILFGLFGITYRNIIRENEEVAQIYIKLINNNDVLEILRLKNKTSQKLEIKTNSIKQTFYKIKDSQEYINKLLLNRSSSDLFLNTSFFASYLSFDFLTAGSSNKIKIMEDLLNMNILDKALDITKNRYDSFVNNQIKINSEKDSILQRIIEIQELISKNIQVSEIQKSIEENNKKISSNMSKLDNNNNLKSNMQENLSKLQNTILEKDNEKKDLQLKFNALNNELSHYQIIDNLLTYENHKCPVCGTELTEEKIKTIKTDIANNKNKLNIDITELNNIINNINKLINSINNKINKINDTSNKINNNNQQILKENAFLDKNNKLLNNMIDKQMKLNIEQLEKYKVKLSNVVNNLNEVNQKIELYKTIKDLLSSKSKIRVMLLQQYLDVLADQVLSFIKIFFTDTTTFSIKLKENEKNQNVDILMYLNSIDVSNLSEGEKNIIRIAFILSFIYTFFILYGSNLGLLFFDEVFSSFDLLNNAYTINLLNDFASKMNLQILTIYHGDIDYNLFTHNIRIIKNEENESTIEVD